ncbi:MAG: hypothetical protein ACRBB0_01365 [Pelagimonas sp.]|uniref:hypothetical protein n=1 Tax=Pelagimonas sp. TaxID=2073170 RepID=UPI003D6C07BF
MTDAPKHIWAWEYKGNSPWGPIRPDLSVVTNGAQYTRTDIADQAERDAYARGLADARKVKPLEWKLDRAECEIGRYEIRDYDSGDLSNHLFLVTHNRVTLLSLDNTLMGHRVTAQADYERRILSALTDPMQTPADTGQEYDNG